MRTHAEDLGLPSAEPEAHYHCIHTEAGEEASIEEM